MKKWQEKYNNNNKTNRFSGQHKDACVENCWKMQRQRGIEGERERGIQREREKERDTETARTLVSRALAALDPHPGRI